MNRRRRRSHLQEPAEMNITAFMNLMVILVPFLLITAVFSRIAILELNLPAAAADQQAPRKPDLQLEVILRRDAIEVAQGGSGITLAKHDGHYDLNRVSELLQRIKAQHPGKTDITLLLEPEIPYDALVQVMDTARVATRTEGGRQFKSELFPDISIGDAPPAPIKQARR